VRQPATVARQRLVDDAVRVLMDRAAELGPVVHPHHDGAPGQRAEIDADDGAVLGHEPLLSG
jgi:hypothetical protein